MNDRTPFHSAAGRRSLSWDRWRLLASAGRFLPLPTIDGPWSLAAPPAHRRGAGTA